MKTTLPQLLAASIAAALVAFAGPASQAQTVAGSELPDLNDFGTLDQNHAGITVTNTLNVAPQACAPTSVVNGLIFLENRQDEDPFQNYDPSAGFAQASKADNNLATAMGTTNVPTTNSGDVGGTSFGTTGPYTGSDGNTTTVVTGMAPGLTNYISAGGANPAPNLRIVGGQYATTGAVTDGVQNNPALIPTGWVGGGVGNAKYVNATPTIQYLASALTSDYAVEIGIQWGTYVDGVFGNYDEDGVFVPGLLGGGHAVTLDQISLNLATGTGSIGLLDPDDGATTAVQENCQLSLVGGYLYVDYPTTTSDLNVPLPDDLGTPNSGQESFATASNIFAGNGQTGRIAIDLVEALPDAGSTAALLGLTLFGLAVARRRAQAA